MIKIDTNGLEGNIQVGINRHMDENSHLPTGEYSTFAHYRGYRGNSEEIKTALRELTKTGKYGLPDPRDVDDELTAREINDMISRVKELNRQKDYGLVVDEVNENRNGEVAKLLEGVYGFKLTEEGHVTAETRKPIGHIMEEPVSRA